MLQFDYIFILFFIPIIVGLFWYVKNDKSGFDYPNNIIAKYCISPKIKILIKIIQFFIIAIFCIIISGPSLLINKTKITTEKNNITIILDISKSMLAEDIEPNRITVAKNSIKKFLFNQNNSIFNFIIFAGKPINIISNSNDLDWMMNFIDSISTNYIQQNKKELSWTNIWDSLLLAYEKVKNIKEKKYIILITDWSYNIGYDPLKSAELIASQNIAIYTIWLWVNSDEPLFYTNIDWKKNYFYDNNGNKITGEFDTDLLKKISAKTNWKFFESKDLDSLNNIFEQINSDNNKIKKEEIISQKIALTPFLLLIFFAFIFLENFLVKKYFYYYKIWQ